MSEESGKQKKARKPRDFGRLVVFAVQKGEDGTTIFKVASADTKFSTTVEAKSWVSEHGEGYMQIGRLLDDQKFHIREEVKTVRTLDPVE